MQYVVNKALTHAGNHRHGSAEHNHGRVMAPAAADVDVVGTPNPNNGRR